MPKALAEWERILSFPMPKYTEFAPAWIAAAKLSLDPTGAMISKSSRLTPSLLLSYLIRLQNYEFICKNLIMSC
jgi:hypothetical protein